jgi:hypothetical protein
MNGLSQSDYLLRETILDLLSDGELARVSTAETRVRLEEGDEFLDLERLEAGVQTADGVLVHMGGVLPRKAVLGPTWEQILALLAAPPRPPTYVKLDA